MADTDPTEQIAQRLGLEPAVLASALTELGLRIVTDTSVEAQEARNLEWERNLRAGTLSRPKDNLMGTTDSLAPAP